jgi:hypothetical protein
MTLRRLRAEELPLPPRPERLWTVFLSSSVKDLGPCREASYGAIQSMTGYHCVGMEVWGAQASQADDFCRAKVAECDLFVGILWHCHGSCPAGSQQSYTEREYEAAVALDNPRLMFLSPEDFPLPANLVEPESARERQRAFRQSFQKAGIVATFTSAEDLVGKVRQAIHAWDMQQPSAAPTEKPVADVPKGLRPFDVDDKDFFLELLPPPLDADGLPTQTIGFWKKQIEAADPDKSFRVGLMLGSSGCGKSSLVRAGLLPRLDATRIASLYLEATSAETEDRLIMQLRKRYPTLPVDGGIPELLAAVAAGAGTAPGQKLLLVLDQFEQWLHARSTAEDQGPLVRALAQCDSGRLVCLLLVRDDFIMAANRFLDSLDCPLKQWQNYARVELFDPGHARFVPAAFGRGYGKLPAQLTPE